MLGLTVSLELDRLSWVVRPPILHYLRAMGTALLFGLQEREGAARGELAAGQLFSALDMWDRKHSKHTSDGSLHRVLQLTVPGELVFPKGAKELRHARSDDHLTMEPWSNTERADIYFRLQHFLNFICRVYLASGREEWRWAVSPSATLQLAPELIKFSHQEGALQRKSVFFVQEQCT